MDERIAQLLDDILEDHDCSLSTRELIEEYFVELESDIDE